MPFFYEKQILPIDLELIFKHHYHRIFHNFDLNWLKHTHMWSIYVYIFGFYFAFSFGDEVLLWEQYWPKLLQTTEFSVCRLVLLKIISRDSEVADGAWCQRIRHRLDTQTWASVFCYYLKSLWTWLRLPLEVKLVLLFLNDEIAKSYDNNYLGYFWIRTFICSSQWPTHL